VERLTELFGFKAMYLMYPLLAVICAGIARYVIHHYLMKWAKRTESSIDDRVVGHLDAAVLPLLLLTVLYFFIPWLPLSAIALGWIQKGLLVVLAGLAALFLAKVAGLLLEGLLTRYGKWERILPPLRNLANVILALVWIAVGLRILDVSMTDAGDRLIRVAGIIVGAFVVLRILNLAVMHVERLVQDEDETTLSEAEKRAKTIGKIVNSAGFVLVLGVSALRISSAT
jgi:hypothetical protein